MRRTYTKPTTGLTKIETTFFLAKSGDDNYRIVTDDDESNGPSDKGTSSSFDDARSKKSDIWD